MVISGNQVYCEFCGGSLRRGHAGLYADRLCCDECRRTIDALGIKDRAPELPITLRGRVDFLVRWFFAWILVVLLFALILSLPCIIALLFLRSRFPLEGANP